MDDAEWVSACWKRDDATVRRLVTASNVNKLTTSGCTPLCLATVTARYKLMEWLLSIGANIKGCGGLHCIMMRHGLHDTHAMKILMRAGASAKGDHRGRPLVLLMSRIPRCDSIEPVAKLLIMNGARLASVASVVTVPKWAYSFEDGVVKCKRAALLLCGIWRLKKSPIMRPACKDVMGIIARIVWDTRAAPAWTK